MCAVFAAAVVVLWLMVPNEYDLSKVLPAVTAFTDTARAGVLPPATAAAYPFLERTPAAADPIAGGFFMASDYVKYSFPLATSMTLLAWSLVEFSQGYAAAGQLPAARAQLRWGADYLMRAHTNSTAFVVQVGDARDYLPLDASTGTGSWGRPSEMPPNRRLWLITPSSKGGADAVAAAAAALAATYQVFQSADPAYAQSALRHAQELYALATLLPSNATYCAELACAGPGWSRFTSSSTYDDMSLAASWLWAGTGVRSYAVDAQFFYRRHVLLEAPAPANAMAYAPSYDNSAWGAAMLLAQLLDFEPAKADLLGFFQGWMLGADAGGAPVTRITPRGLRVLGDTPLPTAAHAAALALIYVHSTPGSGGPQRLAEQVASNMECFALQQVSYALGGQLGAGRSFVVGLGPNAPSRPAHPQASCAWPAGASGGASRCSVAALADARPNPAVIRGALVAGPDAADGYADERSSAQSAVSPLFNIPYAAAVAGLLQHGVRAAQCQRGQGLFQTTFLSRTPT